MDSKEVFISYSSKQAEMAFAVCDYLEKQDIRCWIAPRDIPSGSNYTLEIPSGIQQCKVMVLMFSETATQSQWITLEVMSAVNSNMTIIPFRIEDFPVNSNMGLYFMLQKSQWIDAFPKFEDQLENLKKDIEKIIGKKSLNLNPTDPIDQFQLGMNYFSGTHLPKDYKLARKWFTVAAKQGHVKSMKMLGDIYKNIKECYNPGVSTKYYKLAAEAGDSQSQYIIGTLMLEENNIDEAIKWYEKSVKSGSFESVEKLAELFYNGTYIEKDYKKAYEYCEKAVMIDSPLAYFLMGKMNLYGQKREINYKLAIEYLHKAKDRNCIEANELLGLCYEHGYGVKRDLSKAHHYYSDADTPFGHKQLAELHNKYWEQSPRKKGYITEHYYTSGLLYEKNQKDREAAVVYRKAAKRGSVNSMARLSIVLGKLGNLKESLVWLREAAKKNSPEANYELAKLLENGLEIEGIEKNKEEAFKLFKLASELGEKKATVKLASLYLNGIGTQKNEMMAVALLQSIHNIYSSRQDHWWKNKDNHFRDFVVESDIDEEVCSLLGNCYHLGLGVKKNYEFAIYYLEKAFDSEMTELELGDIYSEGGYGISSNDKAAMEHFKGVTLKSHKYSSEEGWYLDKNSNPQGSTIRAYFEVGWRYLNGCGVERNISKGIEFLKIASKAKYKPAIALLYNLYVTNCFIDPNKELQNLYLNLAKDNDIYYISDFIISKEAEISDQNEINYYINLLKIFIETFGEKNYHSLIVLERLSNLYLNSKQYFSALEINRKALDIQIKLHGEKDSTTAMWYSNIAYVYGLMEDYEIELKNILKGIDILNTVADKDPGDLVILYRNLARCYSNLEEFKKEEQAAKNAFEISLNIFGDKNPLTVHSIETFAESAIHLGNYEKALNLYLKALSIYLSETGNESQPTAKVYDNISNVYWSIGNLEEAMNYGKKALQIYKNLFGEMSRECEQLYENLGLLYFRLGKHQDSIDFLNKAYYIVKKSDIKIGMGYYAHKLGIVYEALGDKETAKAKLEEALTLLPEEHPEAIDSKERLEELENQ